MPWFRKQIFWYERGLFVRPVLNSYESKAMRENLQPLTLCLEARIGKGFKGHWRKREED
ncbi:hypothetical protein Q648_00621 [Bartonella quintana JK 12]|nr:hypothetical protein Q650_01035 [Bartonella quintana JK 73rel]ETS18086.1 hypothetical protein Q647_01032 [Bartonella quintana JK 7]ETS18915.1 hypothetical protein Q648_00621 [Bartonella quintana JK 12]